MLVCIYRIFDAYDRDWVTLTELFATTKEIVEEQARAFGKSMAPLHKDVAGVHLAEDVAGVHLADPARGGVVDVEIGLDSHSQ